MSVSLSAVSESMVMLNLDVASRTTRCSGGIPDGGLLIREHNGYLITLELKVLVPLRFESGCNVR